MVIYLIAVGFVSILAQVVVLRELSAAFYGIELIYILSMGIWLIGAAAGASAVRRKTEPKTETIQLLFFLNSVILIADIVFIRGISQIFQGAPGAFLPFSTQLTAMLIAIIPLSFPAGLLFQLTAKKFMISEGTPAKAYSIESFGGIAGGLASTVFLYMGLQNFSIALICSLYSAGTAAYYSWRSEKGSYKYLFASGFAVLLIFNAASLNMDLWMTSWNHPFVIGSRDTPYSRVTITAFEDQVSVFEDGLISYDTETSAPEEFIQLSTLYAEKPDHVLVLGSGFCGIISELLKLPVERIDYVEVNRNLIETLEKDVPGRLCIPLKDRRVNIIYDDPRKYLSEERTYDVIIAAMPEPNTAQSNRFYTAEFFKECSRHMTDKSIIVFKIRSPENLWTQQLSQRNRSIYNALLSTFKNVIVLPGQSNIFIASLSSLSTDPEILALRFINRNPSTKLVSPEYIREIYTNSKFSEVKHELLSGRAEANSDMNPSCYSYTISIWLSKFFSGSGSPDEYLSRVRLLFSSWIFRLIFILITLGLFFIKRLSSLRRFMLVLFAGFSGMAAEAILILNYQSKSGFLYRDIGILLMMFMSGLSLGAYLVNRLLTSYSFSKRSRTVAGIVFIICFTLLNIALWFLIRLGLIESLEITSTALIIEGIFTASIFAYATIKGDTDKQQESMVRLYSADLIGGSLGSIAASLLLIPAAGLAGASLIIAIITLYTLIFIR